MRFGLAPFRWLPRRLIGGLALLGAAWPQPAWADGSAGPVTEPTTPTATRPTPRWETAEASRRGGFTVGISPGLGAAWLAGYPNDPSKVNVARFRTDTGLTPSAIADLWIGLPLSDWINFGIGASLGRNAAIGQTATSLGFIFRIELFPWISLGSGWQDAGVLLDFGTGRASVGDPLGNGNPVDSGSASMVAAGVFYEGIRGSRFATGPTVMASYMWSNGAEGVGVYAGWRMALYSRKIPSPPQ